MLNHHTVYSIEGTEWIHLSFRIRNALETPVQGFSDDLEFPTSEFSVD